MKKLDIAAAWFSLTIFSAGGSGASLFIFGAVLGAPGTITARERTQEKTEEKDKEKQDQEGLRKVTKKVAAVYPPLARQGRLTGAVKLVALVSPEGEVKSVRTVGGNPVLAAAAEEAVKQWKYEVAKKESSEPVTLRFAGPE